MLEVETSDDTEILEIDDNELEEILEIDEEEFIASIERIREIANTNNSGETVAELEKIVPTFNHVVIK